MNVRTEVEEISPVKKKLRVEVPVETVLAEFNRVATTYRRHSRIAGFRPGKAPVALVKRRYRKDIRQDVLRKLIPESYDQSIRERKIRPLGQLQLEQVELNEGKPLVYEALVETLPEFQIPEYRGLEVRLEKRAPDEESVNQELERLRDRNAPLISAPDRDTVRDGDYAVVDLLGRYVPGEDEAIRQENTTIRVGDERTQRDFNQALLGMETGEEKTFVVDYPQDYPEEKLAGRRVRFNLQLNDVKVKDLPDLNDEFAKDLGDFDDLDQLKEQIRQGLANQWQQARNSSIRRQLVQRLSEVCPFQVPDVLVEDRIDNKIRDVAYNLARQGVDPSKANLDWNRIRDDLRHDAEREARAALILSEIAENENLEVKPAEFEAELRETADALNQPLEKIRQRFHDRESKADLETRILRRKALELLVEHSAVSEE
ncbi:MAG: trigger factor [Candidatus Aminicenantes bacterium]|nr:trigger factor [Candidatus Aminicenantes bacterium]